MSQFGPPLPEPLSAPGPTAEQVARREAIKAEMQATAAQAKKLAQRNTIIAVCLVVGLVMFVGRCANTSIVSSHYRDGIVAYMNYAKHQPECKGDGSYAGSARNFFDSVIRQKPDWPEPYIYRGSMSLMKYDCDRQKSDSPDTSLVTKANEDFNNAQRYGGEYPDAYYYMAAVDFYNNDKDACVRHLDKCAGACDAYYGSNPTRQKQWKEQAQKEKDRINGMGDLGHEHFSLRPIEDMLPGWQLIR